MSLDWVELLKLVITTLATLISGGFAVAKIWFNEKEKIQEKLLESDKQKYDSLLKRLEISIEENQVNSEKISRLTTEIEVLKKEIEFSKALAEEQIRSRTEALEGVTVALRDFVKSTEKRFKDFEYALSNMNLEKISGTNTFRVKSLRREKS